MAEAKKTIIKNTTILYIRMGVVMIVNIFSIRIVLKNLGSLDYGIFDVVAGIVTMFASLSGVLSASTQRYLSIALGEKKLEDFQRVFSSSINAFIILSIIIVIICETAGVWFVNTKLVIPPNRLFAANVLFQFSLISFILTILQTPFSASIITFEDINIYAYISLADCLLKFGSALLLYLFIFDHLIIYGALLCLISLIITLLYIGVTIRKYESCKYRFRDNQYWKGILAFSGWTLYGTAASVSMNQICTFLVNIYFGPIVNAARSIANQISSVLNSFCANILTAVRPPIVKAYAENNFEYLNKLLYCSSKIIFFMLIILFIPLYLNMQTVLSLWLGNNDPQTILFAQLMLVYTFILALGNPITIVMQATGYVKQYHIFVEIPTLAVMPLTYILYEIGFSAEITYYTMISAITISHFIRVYCLKKYYPSFETKKYIVEFLSRSLFVLLICGLITDICISNIEVGLFRLFFSCSLSIFLSLLFMLSLGMNSNERIYILQLINSFIRK